MLKQNLASSMPELHCPEACPNRRGTNDRIKGKWGAYSFALLLSFLAIAFSFEATGEGWQPKDEPPVFVWAVFLPIIGGCLGVQVEPETIARLLTGLSKSN
jgi:hypothetical protein